MADERSPIGGDFSRVAAELQAMRAEIRSIGARVARAEDAGVTRAGAAREARTEAGQRPRGATPKEAAGSLEAQAKAAREAAAAEEALALAEGKAAAEAERAAAAQAAVNVQRQKLAAYGRTGAQDLAVMQQRTQQLAQVQAGASQQMRRHGALTTEFLSAAARGDATLSEFRFQIGATIAKFAGWTAASAAVFAVLGSVRELGRGAIDSLNSVNLLTRVINNVDKGRAAQSFSDLSKKFNLPIADVGAATFQFAQVYGNQDDAFKAVPAALYAVKVGELDAAEAGKLLISIQQGMNGTAEDTVTVFDQINQAQNKFGVRIRDTTSGLAKATGAFTAAGGSVSTLLALIATGSRVSGRSGDQLGTALQRSAGLVERGVNQKLLRGFGIDPTAGINEIYEEAIRIAPSLTKRQQLRLARALSTPQLAPAIVGILQHGDLFRQIQQETSPAASKGSAARELEKQLKSASEQLTRFSIGVQRLGLNLAQLGAFNVFGLMLHAINGSVDAVNSLLALVNKLPGPFKSALVIALQLAGTLKLLRRFNVGAALPDRFPGAQQYLQQPALVRGRRGFERATRNEIQALTNEREQITQRLPSQSLEGEYAALRKVGYEREASAARTAGDVEREHYWNNKVLAANTNIMRIEQEIEASMIRQDHLAARITAKKDEQALARTMTRQELLAAYGGTAVPAAEGPPTAQPPRTLATILGAHGPATEANARVTAEAEENVRRIEEQARALAIASGRPAAGTGIGEATGKAAAQAERTTQEVKQADVARRSLAETMRRDGAVMGAFNYGSLRVYEAASTLVGRSAGAKGALTKAGASLRAAAGSLLSMLGPLEYAIIGYIAIETALEHNQRALDHLESDRKRREHFQSRASVRQDMEYLRSGNSPRPRGIFGVGGESQFDYLSRVATQYNADQTILDNQGRAGITSGKRNFLLLPDTLKRQINDASRARNNGVLSLAAFDDALTTAIQDVQGNIFLSEKGKKALTQKLRETRALSAPTLSARFQGEPDENIAVLGAYESLLAHQRNTPARTTIRSISYGLGRVATQLGGRGASPQDLQTLGQEQDNAVKAITDQANAQLQSQLLYARSQAQRNAAYARARGTIRGGTSGLNQLIRETQQRIAGEEGGLPLARGLDSIPGSRGNAAEALKQKLLEDRANLRILRTMRRKLKISLDEAARILSDQQFEDQQAYQDALTNIQVARTGDAGLKIAIQLRNAGRRVAQAIRRFGRNATRTLNEIQRQEELLTQQSQHELDVIASRGELAAARSPTEAGSNRARLNSINQQLGKVRGDPRLRDEVTINGLLAQRAEIQKAQAEARKQAEEEALQKIEDTYNLRIAMEDDGVKKAQLALQRDKEMLNHVKGSRRLQILTQYYNDRKALDEARLDLANSEYELELSATDDPVEQALIKVRQDKTALQHAKGRADRNRAQAQLNNDARSASQAAADAQREQLQYMLDIGQIGQQEFIEGLKKLLKIKGLGKHYIEELKRQIGRAEHDQASDLASYELTVGNIRLPTTYEIRRAAQESQVRGGGAAVRGVNVNNNVQIRVEVHSDADAGLVYDAIDSALGTGIRSGIRAAGAL